MHVLVVEDDTTIGMGLVAALEHERFDVTHVTSGEAALAHFRERVPDLVVSDIMLPGIDGLQVMRQIKQEHPNLPVIMLTARTEEIDRVMGLEMGADDYVTKPFSSREVIARVKARLRDQGPGGDKRAPEVYEFGNVKFDMRRGILWKDGQEEHLTTHEAGTLSYLISHRGSDVSRDELLLNVWKFSAAMNTRTVDNQILKLRKRIEEIPAQPRHILTVHGTGYRFEP